jgi:hypothetical protein
MIDSEEEFDFLPPKRLRIKRKVDFTVQKVALSTQTAGGKINGLRPRLYKNNSKEILTKEGATDDEEDGLVKEELALEHLGVLQEEFDGSSEEKPEYPYLSAVDSDGLKTGDEPVIRTLRQTSIMTFMKPSQSKRMTSKDLAITSTSTNSVYKGYASPHPKIPKKLTDSGHGTITTAVPGGRLCPFYKRVPGFLSCPRAASLQLILCEY